MAGPGALLAVADAVGDAIEANHVAAGPATGVNPAVDATTVVDLQAAVVNAVVLDHVVPAVEVEGIVGGIVHEVVGGDIALPADADP